MLTGYSIQDQFKDLFGALRRLWEIGRVSELKTPFYEPIDQGKKAAE